MKIEKKTVFLCIVALAIGIATIIPLTYLAPKMSTPTSVGPWSNVDILYANTIPNIYNQNEVIINISTNFTITPNASNLKGADATIEVYKFHIYSDQTSIVNLTRSIVLSGNVPDPNAPNGVNTAIIGTEKNYTYLFADGTTYNYSSLIGDAKDCGDSWLGYHVGDPLTDLEKNPYVQTGYIISDLLTSLSVFDGEKYAQALVNLENAQTLYIDVTRILSVTYKHQINPSSTVASTTTTLTSKDVLCHIELIKNDNGFLYGDTPEFIHGQWYSQIAPTSTSVTIQPIVPVEAIGIVLCRVIT